MSISIELSPEVEAALRADAVAQDRPVEEVAAAALAAQYGVTPAEDWYAGMTLEERAREEAEVVAAVEEALASDSATDIGLEEYRARCEADKAERKRRRERVAVGSAQAA